MKNDIYTAFSETANSNDYEDLLEQLDWLNDELNDLKRKRKRKKRGKKKVKKAKIKKLNRRIRKIENEMEQITYFIRFMELQSRKPQSNLWWQDAVISSLPQFFEFATATVNGLSIKKQQQLYLPDKQQNN